MAPTSVFAGLVLLWAEKQAKAILRTVPFSQISHRRDVVVETLAFRFGSYFVTWFLGCFALAAVASIVSSAQEEDDGSAWIPDRHQRAREHLGAIFAAALITFGAFLVGMALSQFVLLAASRAISQHQFSRFSYVAELLVVISVASLVSWLGISIPLILRGRKLWAALKGSVELSSGYEGALSLLVVESLAGSFAAAYLTLYSLRFVIPIAYRYAPSYSWVITVLIALVSAAVEAPLFIGFSLLADPEFHEASSLPRPQQPPHIH